MDIDQQTTLHTGRMALDILDAPVRTRRLSDKILLAFHQACDQGDYDTAEQLVHVLDFMVSRPPAALDPARRKTAISLVAAYERLWLLRHSSPESGMSTDSTGLRR